jgi:hypothetical protein
LNKHSNQNKFEISYIILAAVIIYGCGKEEPQRDFVARVEKSYLTKEDLAADLDTSILQSSHKNEYVRNWIESEVLYQEAIKEDIIENKSFNRTVNKSKKELANAFLIKKVLDENLIEYNTQELINYYNSHKNEFRIFRDSYLYNVISFKDEDKAILFRSTLIESDWNKASNVFSGDPSIVSERTNVFAVNYEIQPYTLQKILRELLNDEVSIVLNSEPGRYFIVQLVKKYNSEEIPEFDEIKSKVEDRYLVVKRKEILKNYIDNLYSRYTVEIKRGNR